MRKTAGLIAVFLCIAIIAPSLSGCGLLFGSNDNDTEDVFNPPYLENYYVNKHDPVEVAGYMNVYEYTSRKSKGVTMGGHDYYGGFVFGSDYKDDGCVDLPLEGQYKNISFVMGGNYSEKSVSKTVDGKDEYYSYLYAMEGAYPTVVGQAGENVVGLQFLVDDKVVEEVKLSSYDVVNRYTYNVDGAQKFTVKKVAGTDLEHGVPLFEITVWEDEPHTTGYVPETAGSEPVKLVRDIKPYLIPISDNVGYYPNYASDERDYINMSNIKYVDSIASFVTIGLFENSDNKIFFDLEEKYGYLTFDAGAVDRTTNYDEGSAWLTVTADGKIIFEEVFSTHELPRTVTLDVAGCRQLKFAWLSHEGNDSITDSTGCYFGIGNAYVATTREALNNIEKLTGDFPNRPVKMISELGAFGVYSNVTEAVYDGSTQFKSFSMGGVKYSECIALLSSNNMLYGDKPSCASFNLGGRYSTVSFIAGHISNSDVYKNESLEIYADGVLIKQINIVSTTVPQEYVVDVTGCVHLEFVSGKVNSESLWRPAVGIANLIAYPDGYVKTDLFPAKTAEDYPASCDLIDTFGFYDVHNPHKDSREGAVSVDDGYYDGSTMKNSFTVGDKTYNKGVILHTSVSLSFDSDEIDALAGFSLAGCTIYALAAADEAHESAFAIANVKGSGYTSVTFTVGLNKLNTAGADEETLLMIGADGECVKKITLKADMEPTTYTVEIGECDSLLFWLNCGIDDWWSHYYAVYDITLGK